MNIPLIVLLTSFLSFSLNAEPYKSADKTFKNKKCGYQFNYPADWYAVSEEEADDITGIEPPIDESVAIVMYLSEQKRQYCKYRSDCHLSIGCSGDGTKESYLKQLKWENDYVKHEKTMNPPRTVINEAVHNGEKTEIVVRELRRNEFSAYLYIYCEKVYRLLTLTSSRSYSSDYKNFDDLMKKSLLLEKLFTPDQLVIINSIQCPDASFIYKEPVKPKPKKK